MRFFMFCKNIRDLAFRNTSVKAHLSAKDSPHKPWAMNFLLAAASLNMACLFSMGALCSLILSNPGDLIDRMMNALSLMFIFSLVIRPPYAERNRERSINHLLSPISVAYFLLMMLISFMILFVGCAMDYADNGSFLFTISVMFTFMPVPNLIIMSLVNFEREQVRLSSDENSRHDAILMNGRLVSDGVPKGYIVSVIGLIILAIAGIPDVQKKVWRMVTDKKSD